MPRCRRGSTEVARIKNRMPKRLEPIGAHPSLAQSEDVRGEVRTMPVGQNVILGVVGQQGANARTAAESSSQSSGSRAAIFDAAVEKLGSATHPWRQVATYHSVSPIFPSAPR